MYENKLNNCDFSRKYCKKNSKKLACASLGGRLGQILGLFPRVFVFPASRLYSIIFARKSQKVTEMFRLLLLVCAPGQTHQKNLYKFASYSQNIYLLSSHRSHKSHRERIVTLAFAIRLKTLGNADKRGRSDAPFVRFVRSV